MGFPRKWSGYLSGAVKSTKILSHLSSKNALKSNSISRNNPTSSAVTLNDLHNTWFHLATQKSAFFYCGRPKSMWYSGGFRGGAWRARFPAYFKTTLRPEGPKTISFETTLLLSQGVDDRSTPPPPPPPPPPPLSEGLDPPQWHLTFFAQGGGGGDVPDPHISLTHMIVESQKYTHVQHPFDKL